MTVKPARFEQGADRRRGDAFAERRDDTAGDEDVLRAHDTTSLFHCLSASARSAGRVDPHRVARRLPDPDRVPGLQPAQLLERLRLFERGGRQRRHLRERRRPVGVDAQVFAIAGLAVAVEGMAAREKYRARPSSATATLTVSGSRGPGRRERPGERRDRPARAGEQRRHDPVDVFGRHQRFVPLHVHVYVGRHCTERLRHAVRSARRRGRRHDGLAAASRTQSAIRASSVATSTRSTRFAPRTASRT